MIGLPDIADAIDRTETLFCTVVTRSHLHWAWVLQQGLRRHHPDAPFCVLVLDAITGDDLPEQAHFDGPFVRIDAFMTREIREMTVYYTAYELCGNIKPSFILHLFRQTTARKIVYLDSDLFLVGPLTTALGRLDTHDATCAPHTLAPIPPGEGEPSDLSIAHNGTFNTGFMGFARSAGVSDMLAWMADRVVRQGFNDYGRGMFCEQRFFNLGVTFLRDRFSAIFQDGYNVGYWNLQERVVERRSGVYFANGQRVAYFHMSGFDPDDPDKLSAYDERYTLATHPQSEILRSVVADYRSLFQAVPFTPHTGYRFDTHNGIPLNKERRRHYFAHGVLNQVISLDEAMALARRLLDAGDHQKAAQAYGSVLAKMPRNIGALYGYGLALLHLDERTRARQMFHQLLALDPHHEGARQHLALLDPT